MNRTMMAVALAALGLAAMAAPAQAQDARGPAQHSASRSYETLHAMNTRVAGSQDSAMRRCRSYMDEAASSDKLGAKDMAVKHWDKAARGCKSEAVAACRTLKTSLPLEQCNMLETLYPR